VANTILTPSVIARRAIAIMYRDTVLSQLVHRDYEDEFANKIGDTITIRKPQAFTANDFNRATGVVIQNYTETGVPMVLNKFKDVSFSITAEELTLKLDDFSAKFIQPAVQAIIQAVELDLLALRANIPTYVGNVAGEMWNTPEALIAARRELSLRGVPSTGRVAVVGSITAGEWLKNDLLKKADMRGDTQGLREASLGNRLFGFDAYEHNGISLPPQTTGNPGSEVSLAFHRDAIALAVRPLAIPMGVAAGQSAIASYNGLGIRVTYGYDIKYKVDMVSLDILYGMAVIDAQKAIQVHAAPLP
jgi:hypothetical protein